ncbi:hypothetical protein G6F37_003547 [Rhizopus arrhizus]|nr:hypothetical protein G6F38_003648 [Rhizopus arrhizus]KAG1160911.1 hypothetical protein G6F37_003547 [Rhizopus arrhizus]
MSGVLVLQKRYNYQSFPVDIFPSDLLRSMHAHVIGSYSRCTFNPQILCQVIAIIQKYTDDQIDEEKAKIDLLNCSRIAETNERAVINAVVALISNLYDLSFPLWQAHWKHIFDDKPFWPDEAAARATQMLRRMHAENKLAQPRRSRQPHPVV